MTLAIMQPYFFPYIGYFQLINVVDTFIIYDDVNYIKQGYINKNNILGKNKPQALTLELKGASSNSLINEIEIGRNRKKLLKTIQQNYSKAPFFNNIMPLIEEIINNKENNLAIYVGFSLQKIAEYLQIDTNFLYSSQIEKNCSLRAQDKVIDICKNLQACKYINSIGGQELYCKEIFEKDNIELNFIKTDLNIYRQFDNKFVPYLSIIDILMFNDTKTVSSYLKNYKLI